MTTPAAERRDHQTAKTTAGVRVVPGHWGSVSVHAFRTWTGEATLTTWCGLEVDLSAGGAHTTDLISCLQCSQASFDAIWGKGAPRV